MPEGEDNPVEDALPRIFRGHYYGENDITELASQISGSLDKNNFAQYIQTDSDDTIEYLFDSYKQWYPDITSNNYCQLTAKRFDSIINNADTSKSKKAPPVTMVAGRAVSDREIDYEALKKKYGVPLVAEAYGECSNEGCTKSLYIRSGNTLVEDYAVVVIDPSQSTENANNLIATCPTCGKLYANTADEDTVSRMKAIKEHLIMESEAMGELAHEK